jgi:hypothetical protein
MSKFSPPTLAMIDGELESMARYAAKYIMSGRFVGGARPTVPWTEAEIAAIVVRAMRDGIRLCGESGYQVSP